MKKMGRIKSQYEIWIILTTYHLVNVKKRRKSIYEKKWFLFSVVTTVALFLLSTWDCQTQ